ncbi:esterase/lipase family protein [Macrococcoides bohemicum]|uniref:triacylglycerol lipase n=1 Tax=Macrococcoides bohemicum TaxID=1903056 RepID=A0A328A3J5_9STAP|nr:triacylglycerol lipase [Macrococcus bohemicus]RAK49103.1 lipase [Macrococcus bohemicus]
MRKRLTTIITERAPILPERVANNDLKINKEPIILVHGFAGFARDNTPHGLMPYWGGLKVNITSTLNIEGYNVYEASIGSMTSSYDRAVELYYYIKGGRVDYGAYHSKKFGHHRFGKTYEGIFPDWQPGKKVHFIGHSMGGQTIRILEHMLRYGRPEEVAYANAHHLKVASLFIGGQDNMINTITTIGTPHNGTYIADRLGNKNLIKSFFYRLVENEGIASFKVDWGFGQWGLRQQKGESYFAYIKRVRANKLWQTTDNGFYDLTLKGSEEINNKLSINPNIRYKSYSTVATHKSFFTKYQIANVGMFAPFYLTGIISTISGTPEWWENDGLVPAISAEGPFTEPRSYNKKVMIDRGIWHVVPRMYGWDHMDQIGGNMTNLLHTPGELIDFYRTLVKELVLFEK